MMYLLSIAAARKRLLISTAYFVPGENTVRQLIEARRRGVVVRIIAPGENTDSEIARLASRALYGRLIREGVEIYEFQPARFHVKTLVVDDRWVSVGSTNLDERSFRLNSESNLNVLDAGFAEIVARIFEADRSRSRRITLTEWRRAVPSKKRARFSRRSGNPSFNRNARSKSRE